MSKPDHQKTTLPAKRGPGGSPTLAGKSLSPAAIKAMKPGDELADPEHRGLRVRRVHDQRVFFYRYKNADGALRQVKV
ncbi:MAG TPA: hypothetical protein VFU71_22260, partial [Burkholderiaceae bacterium]|nr:hypothetical protein [Burkholderiaceae bacterium]